MGTTARGFTYPDPVDTVESLPGTVQDLAEEVNDHVGRHAAGTVTGLVLAAAGTATQPVVFPVGRFTAAPVVVTNITSGIPASGSTAMAASWASAITDLGFTMNYRRGAADTGTVAWIAVEV